MNKSANIVPKDASVISSLDLLTAQTVTEVHIAALKHAVSGNPPEDKLLLFAYLCNRYQLDPFANQIYLIKRRVKIKGDDGKEFWEDKWTFQIGIEGRLSIAKRSGTFAGISSKLLRDKSDRIIGAVAVARDTSGALYEEEIDADEFAQDNYMWKKMRGNQTKKCAKNAVLKMGWPINVEYKGQKITEDDIEDITEDRGYHDLRDVGPQKEPDPVPLAEEKKDEPKKEERKDEPLKVGANLDCCGRKMMKDKFTPNAWFCVKCKNKIVVGK